MPFPELFGDLYGLLLFAENAYRDVATYTGDVRIGVSLVNVFDRVIHIPTDVEDFLLGTPQCQSPLVLRAGKSCSRGRRPYRRHHKIRAACSGRWIMRITRAI